MSHNETLALKLAEVFAQYQSGLLTAYELLQQGELIGMQRALPVTGELDQNTGLRY
jgi:hypothetical protein